MLKLLAILWVLFWPMAALGGPLEDLKAGNEAHKSGDTATARQFWQKAGEAGNPIAQFNLGIVYHFGKGAKKNYGKALHWYRKSARQNHKTAQFNLGRMYENGLGVTRDRAEAVHWYRKASGQGHKSAEIRLKKMGAWKGAGTGGGQPGQGEAGNLSPPIRLRSSGRGPRQVTPRRRPNSAIGISLGSSAKRISIRRRIGGVRLRNKAMPQRKVISARCTLRVRECRRISRSRSDG
jgi:hypothetical protein